MGTRGQIAFKVHCLLPVLFLWGLIGSCAPTLSSLTPPENYKGPITDHPTHQGGDYWVYERDNRTRVKVGTATLTNLRFPLWIGKTWSYQGGALLLGQPQESKAFRIPTQIDCEVTGFGQITVTAGTFGAFECRCLCTVLSSHYNPYCGESTIWYASEVKSIVRIKTQSTNTSMELAEYKVSPTISRTQVTQEKLAQGETKPIAQTGVKAEKPEWKVGYEWRYAWKGPKGSGTLTREIVREDAFEGVPSYVMRAAKSEYYITKNGLGELAGMSGGRLTLKRDSPYQFFSWPLEIGKEWKNSFLSENIQEKSSQTFDLRMVIVKIEEIKVPAGTFETFKIEAYDSYGGNLTSEYWYSPKAKWFVRFKRYLREGVREEELISLKVD